MTSMLKEKVMLNVWDRVGHDEEAFLQACREFGERWYDDEDAQDRLASIISGIDQIPISNGRAKLATKEGQVNPYCSDCDEEMLFHQNKEHWFCGLCGQVGVSDGDD